MRRWGGQLLDWAATRRRRWRARSRSSQVELTTQASLLVLPWVLALAGLPQVLVGVVDKPLPTALSWAIGVCTMGACVLSTVALRRSLTAFLGSGPAPRAIMWALGVLQLLLIALSVALVALDALRAEAQPDMVAMAAIGAFLGPYALLVTLRTALLALSSLCGATLVALWLTGMGVRELVASALVLGIGGLAVLFTSRCTGWYVVVLRELEQGRDAQARLAVAEERLRFGRDIHDVVGRNLSAIALKSELAAQLARRGSDTAVDQMVEVQRIARDSQREVREVVRGYREADLRTELAGARGILLAAGIDCRTESADGSPTSSAAAAAAGTGTGAGPTAREADGLDVLPQPVRAALGWVVREGTTNVLRHADASRCTVALRTTSGSVRLTMDNDGVPAAAGPSDAGSGLRGLRERLAALGGTLTAGPTDGAGFRLTAEVPLGSSPGRVPARPDAMTAPCPGAASVPAPGPHSGNTSALGRAYGTGAAL